MMRLTTKFTAGALGLALGAVLAWPAPVHAEEDVPLDTRVIRGILEGIGLRKDGDQILSYPERAPLVIPSGKVLPPPEKSDAVIEKNPAWPVDPDVKRRKAEAALERKRSPNLDQALYDNDRPLRPEELTPGPKPSRTARQTDDGYKAPVAGYGNQLPPSELGTKNGGFFSNIFGKNDEEVGKFTGEPPRASLTEPPPGYQTPSSNQPYGTGKDKPKQRGPVAYDQAVGTANQ